ncbi:MAG TPA: hypothetical protein VHK69_03875 [Chitinophagaceae bacterium]|jgi:hypothetical protein|nr:hypothetical protein [Chitinophagaceae bacterium]
MNENKLATASFARLKAYCEQEEFKGWDPYDGLNSRFFQALPGIRNSRLVRLAWIQAFKRMPFNLRPLFGVRKGYNPKALGLFLSAYCLMYRREEKAEYLDRIRSLSRQLLELRTSGWSGDCWGYNFDWQARAFLQPKGTPTVVASSFIANALLDAYDITGERTLLDSARSTCTFFLTDLHRTYDEAGNFSFSYSPLDKSVVYNATLLGTRLLARVYKLTGEDLLRQEAKRSLDFCCSRQKEDGSWAYGTYHFHQWIDNFHTGFNLECISDYIRYTGETEYETVLEKGFDYYVNTFFTEEGMARYYSNQTFPIDVHAPAQLLITLVKMDRLAEYRDLADRVLNWTIKNMQDPKGYFYYQYRRRFSSRIPYMRWAQAWMFYAMTTYQTKIAQHETDHYLQHSL